MKPLVSELQGFEGKVVHACDDAAAIWSVVTPELQKLAIDRICFIPYCDKDPQCVSNVLTCTYKQRTFS